MYPTNRITIFKQELRFYVNNISVHKSAKLVSTLFWSCLTVLGFLSNLPNTYCQEMKICKFLSNTIFYFTTHCYFIFMYHRHFTSWKKDRGSPDHYLELVYYTDVAKADTFKHCANYSHSFNKDLAETKSDKNWLRYFAFVFFFMCFKKEERNCL